MPEIIEHRIIQEFPCYYDLYIPEGEGPKPLIIALHGYGGDKISMMKLVRRINERDFAITALQGPHQHMVMPTKESPKLGFGFGWLTNFKSEESTALHHSLLLKIIETVGGRADIDAKKIFLIAFSQGVGLNFRFAFTHPGLIRGIVAICGGIPGDWENEGKYVNCDLDVLYIAGEKDEFYTPERMRKSAEDLRRRARSVELCMFDAGHEVPRDSYTVINEWLKIQTG